MAHTGKSGLNYFPFDVDFFSDEKIEFLSARFGLKGEAIAVRLLCKIYRNGYFLKWGDDEALLFAKRVGDGCQHSFVNDVVYELVKRGFLDESIFNRFAVLTSKGIQKRFIEASERRKKIDIFSEFLLIDITKLENVNILPLDVYILNKNVNILPQNKEKESKEKESISPPPPLTGGGSPKNEPDFIDLIIECFTSKYNEIRGIEYHVMHREKERSCASKILKLYRQKYPDANTQETLNGLGIYFESCIQITSDEWINTNMSIPILVNKFNEINNILKKDGTNKRNSKTVASRANEIDAIVDAVFASKGN